MKINLAEADGLANSFLIFDLGLTKAEESLERAKPLIVDKLNISRKDSALVIFDQVEQTRTGLKQMRIMEKDGSESLMCGNGLRAVGKYLFEAFGREEEELITLAGPRKVKMLDSKNFEADLGKFEYEGHYFLPEDNLFVHMANVGEPHAVIFCTRAEVEGVLSKYGLPLAKDGLLAGQKIGRRNLNVVELPDDFFRNPTVAEGLRNRTFERGVNAETMACGTGSACVAGVFNKLRSQNRQPALDIITRAGNLRVNMEREKISIVGAADLKSVQLIDVTV
ncbi:hypothetical protein IT411_03990 [Candidatus Peregrinibacteria bacterium]|nr:hypothetical protein [Candidatus Peregrinibacteria bacterium]